MPIHTRQEFFFGALSLAIFPASLGFVWYLIDNPKWSCFSDWCISSPLLIRTNLWLFYGFLAFAGVVALFATRIPALNRILSKKPLAKSTISVGELGFSYLMLIMVITASVWNYKYFHDRRVQKWVKDGKPFAGLILDNLYNASGDICAILMGLSIFPVSKNSFLATFLGIPYTSLVQFHIWFSRGLFWTSWFHFGSGLAYLLVIGRNSKQLLVYYFEVDNRKPWGKKEYYIVMGFVAIFSLTFVAMTSLDYVRRRWYNTFFYTHVLVFAFMLFAYLHASSCIYFALPGLLLYTIDGFLRLHSRIAPKKDHLTSVTFETSGYVTLTIATTKAARALPGQFMRVCFPSVSKLEFHPWSIVDSSDTSVTFLFVKSDKSEKEWSSLVVEYLKRMDSEGKVDQVEACLQGPFGKEIEMVKDWSPFSSLSSHSPDVLVFCVGGTGIAASTAAIKRVLLSEKKDAHVFLFWTSRAENLGELSLLKGLSSNGGSRLTIHLFETGQGSQETEEWVTGDSCDTIATPVVKDEKSCIELVSSRTRPDLNQLLLNHVAPLDVSEKVLSVGVFVCGPKGLALGSLTAVNTFRKEHTGFRVDIEVESFYL
ncbi:hypothetical protein BDR26DRAFT_860471 [Obelidium mucronatum]|nr:hypothetical protein BDR26DRAFT_860471 [Obelidium mucronatum]